MTRIGRTMHRVLALLDAEPGRTKMQIHMTLGLNRVADTLKSIDLLVLHGYVYRQKHAFAMVYYSTTKPRG